MFMKMAKDASGSYIMELTNDLILEIFFRLPSKYIVRCKCVCTAWYEIISDPNFTSNYTRNSHYTTIISPKSVFKLEVAVNGELFRMPIKPKFHSFSAASSTLSIFGSCNDEARQLLEIFTIEIDDKWRRVKDPLTLSFRRSSGTCFNGAYHWIDNNESLDWICTFDFGEEKGGRVSKPPGLVLDAWCMDMVVLNNNLSLVDSSNWCFQVIIWTMKEYGVAESWSKSIISMSWLHWCKWDGATFPITTLPNGNIIFSACCSGTLLSFNPQTKQCTKIEVCDADPGADATAVTPTYI